MHGRRLLATLVASLALMLATTLPAFAANPNTDSASAGPNVDQTSAIVLLSGDPLSTYSKTRPAPGKKVDFDSNTVKSYRAQLSALRNDFKSWLRANAPQAKVTGEYDISLNAVAVQLNGTALTTLRTAPMVVNAQYEGLYHPTSDPDLAVINAIAGWGAGGAAGAGAGVKVGVLDTGIDITHPCFSDAGYAPQTQLGDHTFTNNKVIVAKVFNNKTPSHGYTAEALQEHGTHVAGTIACDYLTPANVNGVAIPYAMSGVAPAALLGNYNIFPGDVTNARSEDILDALDAAYADGMDVVNMSLGGGASGIQDLLTIAVDDLDIAGMISAVAAGNSGPGHYTVESPGSAARALTAGASTVGHFIGTPVTVGGTTYGAAAGDFAKVSTDLTAPLGVVTGGTNGLGTACSALPAASLAGKIALISRGACTFSTKIRNAQDAGASAVLVANNVGGDPVAMGQDGTANQPTVPAYMVSLATGQALKTQNGSSATIGASQSYIYSGNNDIMAGFSSQGPTDVDFRVKPDVVAPGVNVLSSIPHQFCTAAPCFAFFQGTSMATPHLAGSAAVVISQHPTWSAAQVRSAIVNTAAQGVLKKSDGISTASDVNLIGAGREDLGNAVSARVALDPVSVSFGSVPSGSGQTRTATVTLSTLGGAAADSASITGTTGSGASFSASLSGGVVTVTMSADKGASVGDHQAILRISSGGTEIAHAAVYVFVKQ